MDEEHGYKDENGDKDQDGYEEHGYKDGDEEYGYEDGYEEHGYKDEDGYEEQGYEDEDGDGMRIGTKIKIRNKYEQYNSSKPSSYLLNCTIHTSSYNDVSSTLGYKQLEYNDDTMAGHHT